MGKKTVSSEACPGSGPDSIARAGYRAQEHGAPRSPRTEVARRRRPVGAYSQAVRSRSRPPGALPVTEADVVRAADAVGSHVVRTPTLHSQTLSAITGANLWLKFENLQYTASFKDRGALYRLLQLAADERQRGVVAVSAGNHAQGVAYHATRLGVPATIVMPRSTPNVKVHNTEALGASVVLYGSDIGEAREMADKLAVERALVLVPPFDDP